MLIRLEIQAETHAELVGTLRGLLAAHEEAAGPADPADPAVEAEAPAKRKRGRPSKAETEAAKKPEPEPEPEMPDTEVDPVEDQKAAMALLMELYDASDEAKEAIGELPKIFGVKTLGELPTDRGSELLIKAQELRARIEAST